MNKRILTLALAVVMLIAMWPMTTWAEDPVYSTYSFADVPDDTWYTEAVWWALDEGITNGMGDGTFGPEQTCTRAHVVTFLWRWLGCEEPKADTENPFSDVDVDSWYGKAVLWAVERGITEGIGDNTFGVTHPCTRAQVATFLYRALGYPMYTVSEEELSEVQDVFTDVKADEWYTDAILWATAKGIAYGMGDGTFGINDTCTRAHAVTFLHRIDYITNFAFEREVAKYVVQYINEYRETPCEVLYGLGQVAQYRAYQLTTNYAHDGHDMKEACNYYEYGRLVDMTLVGEDPSKNYWTYDGGEAICAGFAGFDAEEMGKAIANLVYNSPGHWSYIGSSEYSYIAVGVEQKNGSEYGWYACISVGRVNYG